MASDPGRQLPIYDTRDRRKEHIIHSTQILFMDKRLNMAHELYHFGEWKNLLNDKFFGIFILEI